MKRAAISSNKGIILLELLIVLMVIGVLIAGAVRTWDVTISQSRFNQTKKEMEQLTYAIAGNPEYYSEGKRTDFGYIGDMGKLPDTLLDLVQNVNNVQTWHGPYIKVKFAENPDDYLQDAWGNNYIYKKDSLWIRSYTSGSILTPQTWINSRIAQSETSLLFNSISGRVLDLVGEPPGINNIFIKVFIIHPTVNGILETLPPIGQITNGNGDYTLTNVPQGNHKMFVTYMPTSLIADTVTKYVCIYPGIVNSADFRLAVKF